MNVKLLRRVQKFLLAEPRRFDMDDWVIDAYSANVLKDPPCGTACCIAGAAYIVEHKLKLDHTCLRPTSVRKFAVKALDLDDAEDAPLWYGKLFFTDDWPEKFKKKYYMATTPLQRAKAGVARIEHFIKTKGAE